MVRQESSVQHSGDVADGGSAEGLTSHGATQEDRGRPLWRGRFSGAATFLLIVGTLLGGVGGGTAAWYAYKTFQAQEAVNAKTSVAFSGPATLKNAKSGECSTAVVQQGLQVSGTARTVRSEQIWLLVQAPVAGRFYLTAGTGINIDSNDEWSQSVANIGSSADNNRRFILVAVAVNLDAASALERAWGSPRPDNDGAYVDALPVGAYPVAQACLLRT